MAKIYENKHGFQNFFCAFEMYENTDFCIQKIFLLRSFFDHFLKKKLIKKWPEPKKLLKPKITFFMPMNHAKEFLKFLHNKALFSQLFARPLIELSSSNFKAKIVKIALHKHYIIFHARQKTPTLFYNLLRKWYLMSRTPNMPIFIKISL